MDHFLILLLAAGLAIIPAFIAKSKGYSFGGFYAFGFFFLLISLIVVLCLTDRSDYIPRSQAVAVYAPVRPVLDKKCEKCGAYISEEDVFCRRCGENQSGSESGSQASIYAVISEQSEKVFNIKDLPIVHGDNIICPACEAEQRSDRNICYKCGAKFIH